MQSNSLHDRVIDERSFKQLTTKWVGNINNKVGQQACSLNKSKVTEVQSISYAQK